MLVKNKWLSEITKNVKPRLFLAGQRSLVKKFSKKIKYDNLSETIFIFGRSDKLT